MAQQVAAGALRRGIRMVGFADRPDVGDCALLTVRDIGANREGLTVGADVCRDHVGPALDKPEGPQVAVQPEVRDLVVESQVVVGRIEPLPPQEDQRVTPVHPAVPDAVVVCVDRQDDEVGQGKRRPHESLGAPRPSFYRRQHMIVQRRGIVVGEHPDIDLARQGQRDDGRSGEALGEQAPVEFFDSGYVTHRGDERPLPGVEPVGEPWLPDEQFERLPVLRDHPSQG